VYRENPFPILEFDEATTAKLNPSSFTPGRFDTDRMVITFFPEVVEKMKREWCEYCIGELEKLRQMQNTDKTKEK
jgi:hypothetical protein